MVYPQITKEALQMMNILHKHMVYGKIENYEEFVFCGKPHIEYEFHGNEGGIGYTTMVIGKTTDKEVLKYISDLAKEVYDNVKN